MGAQAARIGERIHKEIAHVCKMLVLEIDRELRRATPVDTGHARANWVPSVGQRNTAQASATRVGGQVGSSEHAAGVAQVMAYTLSQGALWVSNVVPYIEALNYGHSGQAPAGFVEMAIDRAITTVRQKLSARGSFIDLAPLQEGFRSELGAQSAGNVADAYSPFGGN